MDVWIALAGLRGLGKGFFAPDTPQNLWAFVDGFGSFLAVQRWFRVIWVAKGLGMGSFCGEKCAFPCVFVVKVLVW